VEGDRWLIVTKTHLKRARARPHTHTHKHIHTAGCIKTRDPERDEEITTRIPLNLNSNRNFIFQAVIEIQNFQYLEAQALHSIHRIIRNFFTRNHCSSFHAQYHNCLKNSKGNIRFVMHCVPSGTTLCSLIGDYQGFR